MKIDVVVADDFALWRSAVIRALESDPAITVVAEAANGDQAVDAVVEHRPDILLLDLNMPDCSGLVALPRVLDASPSTRVLMLTASGQHEPFLAAMRAGASAYLDKRITAAQLVHAVITVHGGGSIVAPQFTACLVHRVSDEARGSARPLLARRETEIVRLVAKGATDIEIGRALHISPRTVQSHLAGIRRKTGLGRRAEIARWAAEHARA